VSVRRLHDPRNELRHPGATAGATWLWLLQDVEPEPGAEDALLEAAARAPEAVLLAPRLLEADGSLRFVRSWPDYADPTRIAVDAERCLLPLREASFRGALVRADAADRLGPPPAGDERFDPAPEWTARLLRGAPGYLVPAAAVRLRPGAAELSGADVFRNLSWTARSDAWKPRERFDRHVQLLVAAARTRDRRAALRGLREGLRARPR
jgi:hypothetical protein